MRCSIIHVAAAFVMLSTSADADSITFASDPFAGSNALTTPGRQVVGGEIFTTFNIASDVFSMNDGFFGVSSISFANNIVGNLPTSGVNTIVLRTFDNDNDLTTPFNAGTAANLIAAQLTQSTPGFFVYFNQGLDLPRLVFSTNLSENTSDLKVLARFTNLEGQAGRDAMATITAANFAIVPEPSSFALLLAAAGFLAGGSRLRRRNQG
jgi:hypothetical protein